MAFRLVVCASLMLSAMASPASAASAAPLRVVAKLFQTNEFDGRNSYRAAVVVRNRSDKVALYVGGQLSVLDAAGRFIRSDNPNTINILPKSEGLLHGSIEAPAIDGAKLGVKLSVGDWKRGPRRSPVSVSDFTITQDAFPTSAPRCTITATVNNRFTEHKQNLQLRFGIFSGSQLVDDGFTYVDEVFPRTPATAEFHAIDCSFAQNSRLVIYPNLGEDKIFNP
jgi:hypothetical protein